MPPILGCDDAEVRDRLHARHPILQTCGWLRWRCPGCDLARSSLELVVTGRVPVLCPRCQFPYHDPRNPEDERPRLEEA